MKKEVFWEKEGRTGKEDFFFSAWDSFLVWINWALPGARTPLSLKCFSEVLEAQPWPPAWVSISCCMYPAVAGPGLGFLMGETVPLGHFLSPLDHGRLYYALSHPLGKFPQAMIRNTLWVGIMKMHDVSQQSVGMAGGGSCGRWCLLAVDKTALPVEGWVVGICRALGLLAIPCPVFNPVFVCL